MTYTPRRRTSVYELIVAPLPGESRNALLNMLVLGSPQPIEGSFPKRDGTVSIRFRGGNDDVAASVALAILKDRRNEATLLVGLGLDGRVVSELNRSTSAE